MRDLIRVGCVALVLSQNLAGSVAAGAFEDGVAAAARGDHATSLRLWRPLADQGDAKAQVNLAIMYVNGLGVRQDYAEAVKWFRKAADQGDVFAQANLGVMYHSGRGVRQDNVNAVTWYRKAAEQGEPIAQFNLGIMYARGRGVPQDYVQAHKWFNLAAARYPAAETENREEAVRSRDLATSKMTAAQIAEAQRLAREWKPK